MRASLICALAIFAAPVANAGPLQVFAQSDDRSSIIEYGCSGCARPAKDEEPAVVALPEGTTIREVREVEGELLLYTTESWLGGSPVTIVRKASTSDIAELAPELVGEPVTAVAEAETGKPEIGAAVPVAANAAALPALPREVDEKVTTAALPADAATAVDQTAAARARGDFSDFELRLN